MLSRLLLSRLSLTRRLSLFFTLVATSVVLGLGGLFMTAADRHFIELDRSVLQDKRHLIDDILASANSTEDLRWRLSEALNHHHGLFARVTTPTGQTLFQTEGFPEPDRWLLPEHETFLHALTRGQHGQRQYRTQQVRAQAQFAPESPLVITLAMDTIHHRHFLDDLLRTFAVYALAAILASGLLGWAAVHYGLAPPARDQSACGCSDSATLAGVHAGAGRPCGNGRSGSDTQSDAGAFAGRLSSLVGVCFGFGP